ncbi:MAG: phage shock protein operon transcriptional activator [Pseudomonadota bacterium]
MLNERNAPDLIGEAPVFLDALSHASAAAALDRPLLVAGERGSGKELIAGRIHFLSPRWDGPFIKVNCAALSDELLDSELFGHEAGSFTGAQRRHLGRFERAEGGTLFLDEIASASLRIQEKLLRVIEYGEFERVGGDKTLNADVRVVAAANVNLPALAAKGDFRADLLDRLAFDVIFAPPLRERKEDIPLLAAHFAAAMAREISEPHHGFTADAMAALVRENWPGNVRELKNAVERSVYRWHATGQSGPVGAIVADPFEASASLADTLSDAPDAAALTAAPVMRDTSPPQSARYDLQKHLHAAERVAVEEALIRHGWNQRRTADILMLTYDQMRGLVRKHDLKKPSREAA